MPAPRGKDLFLVFAVSVGSLMVIFDGSAFQMALPVVVEDLRVPLRRLQWTMTAFLLVNTCALLPVGRVGDLLGRERVWRFGLLLFVAASALCASVQSLGPLIFGRAAQGLAAALIAANSAPILVRAFPGETGKMLGLGNIGLAVGMVAGPPAGAVLTRLFSWRAIFVVSIPIGISVWAMTRHRLAAPLRRSGSVAWFDALMAALGVGALLLGGTSGATWGWLSLRTVTCLAGGGVLLAAFAQRQRASESPLLNLELFRERTFAAGMVGSLFGYLALFVGTTALPFFLLRAQGRSLIAAGILVGIVPITMSLVAPFAGRIADRKGSRWPCTLALVLLATSFLIVVVGGPGTGTFWLCASMVLAGAGVGGFEAPNDVGVLKVTPGTDLAVATAMLSTGRNLGMTAGVAVAATLIDSAASLPPHPGAQTALVGAAVGRALLVGAGAALAGAGVSLFRRC